MSVLPVLPGRAGLLHDRLLVQAGADDAAEALVLAEQPGSGIVLSGAGAVAAARRLERADRLTDVPLLIDRRRYAGRARARGTKRLDANWLDRQRELWVPTVLTDSGYIGAGDQAALRSVLHQAARAGPDVTAVLPLHTGWLDGDLRLLCDLIADNGVPVALVLEHARDPFGVLRVLYGLVTVLALPVPVALLSSDVSALGGLAFGASWTAVGVRSGLRHLYPLTGTGRPGQRVSALVDPALTMVGVERIAAAWAATPDDPDWACPCPTCRGRTLDWLLAAGRAEATAHTFDRLLHRRELLTQLPVGALRRQSWKAQCASAEFQYQALALAGVPWQVPRHLVFWQRL
jgi:hypothetical protein